MKETLKKAFNLAENEIEEKQLVHYKQIIKNLLEKRVQLDKEKDEIEDKIKLIKQDIDDFKDGRLDKVKERHDVNEKADRIAPIKITIINNNQRNVYPTQPWRWNYDVVWSTSSMPFVGYSQTSASNSITLCDVTTASVSGSGTACYSGTDYSNLTSGTYKLGSGVIINLN